MVTALVVMLFAALLQAGIVIHTRNVMIDAASAGARYGALADRTPEQGAQRAQEVLDSSLPGSPSVTITAGAVERDGVPLVQVTVSGSLPAAGFLPGPVPLTVSGHAYRQ